MTMLESAREIIARYNQAILTKDAGLLASLYAEDAVHELPFSHRPPLAGRSTLLAAYSTGWAATPATVDAIRNVVVQPIDGGESFVIEEDIDLTNSGNGHHFTASTVLIMTLADGLIARMKDYTDNLTIATGLGRIPSVVA
jgi:ketosteroid isomerase-like protein